MIHSKKVLKDLEERLKRWKELILLDEFPPNSILAIIESDLREFIRRRRHAYRKNKNQ